MNDVKEKENEEEEKEEEGAVVVMVMEGVLVKTKSLSDLV